MKKRVTRKERLEALKKESELAERDQVIELMVIKSIAGFMIVARDDKRFRLNQTVTVIVAHDGTFEYRFMLKQAILDL